MRRWAGRSVGALVTVIKTTMPPGNAGTLNAKAYIDIAAYLLQVNGARSGEVTLPEDLEALGSIVIPGTSTERARQSAAGPGWPVAEGITLPPSPVQSNLLLRITPVTDALLRNPPNGSWLGWRRTQDDIGFSPLRQINRENVKDLRVAWTLALPAGPNQSTPLVHDGVMFLHSFGDHIFALDATTGEEIWHYSRQLPSGASATKHRAIALYDDKLYVATSDVYVVALFAQTGALVWEQSIGDIETTYTNNGGPLVTSGVVMQGLSTQKPGGSYIVGLDAKTGKILWKFQTIAQPGEPYGNSWNGLPAEKRTGGSVWTPGSYDAEQNLAFFGPAPTYDTGPLRLRLKDQNVTNDALYTNATIALDPKTGRIVWHYQHLPNDQWDFDWAFERQIIRLPINGHTRKLVLTAGKIAVYDAIDAETGAYVFSIDLGIQNIITSIDPKTGRKSIDAKLIPGNDEKITVCPHSSGAKSWLPASFNPETHVLYIPLVESCMDMIPTPKGEPGFLSGVALALRPQLKSDGRYGRLQAIDLASRQTVWTTRQRAPQTSGVLATAGGVVFAGALDRWFSAYDADTGLTLWKIRLSDVPNSSPVSYMVNGKQYIAMVVGTASGHAAAFSSLIPEMRLPVAQSSAIWVFELPR